MANEGKASGTGREDGASSRFAATQGNRDQNSNRDDHENERSRADGQGSLTGSLQNSARTITREIKREGQRLVADATDSATSVARQKTGVAAGYLRTVGDAISNSCGALDEQGYQGTSGVIRRVAEELGTLADTLEDRDPRELLSEVRHYARANPAIFLGATLLAGFGLVRLLKSGDSQDGAGTDEMMDDDTDDMIDDDTAYDADAYDQQHV